MQEVSPVSLAEQDNSPLKPLSPEARLKSINDFVQNPCYAFFCGMLQAESDQTLQMALEPIPDNETLQREQQFGAVPALLRFQSLVNQTKSELIEKYDT